MESVKKLDDFLEELTKSESVIMPVAEKVMERANREYGVKKEDAIFSLKDFTNVEADVKARKPEDEKKKGGEAIVTITTIAKDRDNEVVLPDGGIYDDYEMLRVVLFGHNYSGLGIGKNLWLKNDDQLFSVLARTQYTTAKANPLGEQVYNYRLEDMPLGESIGFVPIEWITPDDKAWGKTFDTWLDRYKQFMNLHQRDIPDEVDLSRIFTLWIMLEYSDVIIPSNPFAIGNAVAKGLISQKDADRYIIKAQPEDEPEEQPEDETEKPIIVQKPETDELSDEEIAEGFENGEPFNVAKPYPNEHACRLNPPDKYDRIRRNNCFKKSDGKCIDYIFGISGGKSEVQAFRYKLDAGWSAGTAGSHCRSHGGSFEAAKPSKESEEKGIKHIRWNKSLPDIFDETIGEDDDFLHNTKYKIYSRFLGCEVKDIYQNSFFIWSPEIGNYLSAMKRIMSDYDAIDTRNFDSDGVESPPRWEVIRITSKVSDDFLIKGTVFYKAENRKLIVKVSPAWSGLDVDFLTSIDDKGWNKELFNKIFDYADANHVLKGEKFALNGGFLPNLDISWKDVILPAKSKQSIESSVKIISDKQKGMKSRGLLFIGPPGTGKTLTGRIIANQVDTTFIWVSSKDFAEIHPVRALSLGFELANKLAPSVLFMEDIDTWIGGYTTDLLKTEMDGIRQNSGVMTILTSNFPEQLPDALLDRPGRFHHIVNFDLPDADRRMKMLESWGLQVSDNAMSVIAEVTDGFSGAHMRELFDFAEVLADEERITLEKAMLKSLERLLEQRQLIDDIRAGKKSVAEILSRDIREKYAAYWGGMIGTEKDEYIDTDWITPPLEAKEGRVLSGKNREIIQRGLEGVRSLGKVAEDVEAILENLLAATEPASHTEEKTIAGGVEAMYTGKTPDDEMVEISDDLLELIVERLNAPKVDESVREIEKLKADLQRQLNEAKEATAKMYHMLGIVA